MHNRYLNPIRATSLVILAAVWSMGIVNLALGRWQLAAFEVGVGGGFFTYFAVQWAHRNNAA